MKFVHQREAETELKQLAKQQHHSILIEGPEGSGKSYLAYEYANDLGIVDVMTVPATVSDIRVAADTTSSMSVPILLCIENLDLGVVGAAYALLKFLEEPRSNIYIVVTCRNIKNVPDTIISRSVCVRIGEPTDSDIVDYAICKDAGMYKVRSTTPLWKVCRSFLDVNVLFQLTADQIDYILNLAELNWNDTVSNVVWKLGHYDDNSETPLSFVLRYMYDVANDRAKACVLKCLTELNTTRLAPHAVLTRFVFDFKYGGIL